MNPAEPDPRATDAVKVLAERLLAAQTLGRFGLWERDPHCDEGWWDAQMFALWDLPLRDTAPGFEEAAQRVLPEDHARMRPHFKHSLLVPGEYEQAIRVRHDDGRIVHLLSKWWVRHGADGRPLRVVGMVQDRSEEVVQAAAAKMRDAQWRDAAALARITLWYQDLVAGVIVQSEQVEHVLGYRPPPQGLSLAAVRRHVHPEDLATLLAAAARAEATGEPVDYEVRYRNDRTGQWRTVLSRRVVRRDAQGRAIAHSGVSLDVTEARAAERRAAQFHALLETATDAAGVGHWRLQHGESSVHWNDAMRQIHGLLADEPAPDYSAWLRRFAHPADRERVAQLVRDWSRNPSTPLRYEVRILRADGQLRHVQLHSMRAMAEGADEGDGDRAAVDFGLAIDTTERRNADARRLAQAERARLAASGVGIGTWEMDLEDLERSSWDEAMWRLRGLAPRDAAPSSTERLALVHPDDVLPMQQIHLRSMRATEALEYEFRVRWPDGQWRWLAGRSSAVTDAEGRIVKRIGVNWDITQTRHLASMQQERSRAVLESQAKSRFLARMSHELRTPLNAVLGFSQMLLDEGEATPPLKRQRRLDNIVSAGQHLLSLINDVLDLSSVESGEFRMALQPVALAQALAQTQPLLEDELRLRNLRLEVDVGDALVQADPTRLRQVLLNLLGNAIKYNRDGGWVRVQARSDGPQHVLVQVQDSGPGLTEKQLDQLFQPFNRLGREAGDVAGTGIGLTIVKSLVERMQGTVSVQSTPGLGSCFAVRLGAAEALSADRFEAPTQTAASVGATSASADAVTGPAATSASAAPRQIVLYVEDNPVNAMIVGELLAGRSDIELRVAECGEQGLAMALADPPHLVLMDMQLPDMSGEEVFKRMRADPRTATVAVVAVSANAMPSDIERALALGMSDYWTKPLDFRAFRSAIDTLFGPAPPRA